MSRWWREVSMQLANLLRETLDVDCDEVWENERSPTPVRVFKVRLHSIGLSVREVVEVLDFPGLSALTAKFGTGCTNCRWVAVDEKQIEVDGENK